MKDEAERASGSSFILHPSSFPIVIVSVKDSGIGIAADQLPRVFEMFSQVNNALERSQGGLGIGLTLVKRLVEMHRGTIEARSDGSGRGSEFIVRLPLYKDEGGRMKDEPEALSASSFILHPSSFSSSSRLRILVVDDNRDGADSLAIMLRVMGHDTHKAYNGEEAVAAAASYRPDVVLLDIGLPKLNGYDACRRIRELPGGKGIFIIAQTGWGQDEDRERSRAAGFDHHLVKPVDPDTLKKLLAKCNATRRIEIAPVAK